jgi:rod shape-determining protein MreC
MLFLKKYQGLAIAFVFIVASLVLLSYNLKRPGQVGFFKKVIMEAAAPIERGIHSTSKGIKEVWDRYLFLVGLESENRNLRKKIAELQNEINSYREMYYEVGRLKKLLSLEETIVYSAVAARVISQERSSLFRTIIIDKGTDEGLNESLPVVTQQGIVGRVIESSWNVSRVLLVTDYNSNIDALVQGSRAQGVMQGGGQQFARLKYVQRTDEVKAGDTVVTSGLGGVFPKGLVLGTVVVAEKGEKGLFQYVEVTPAVDFTKLEEVLVLIPEQGKEKKK